MTTPTTTIAAKFDELTEAVAERLALNKRVRRNLPGEGRMRIDRQLPFLCVYREPPFRPDAGTRELVTTEAAYLFASGGEKYHAGLAGLCRRIAQTLKEHFGMFLFVEIWSEELNAARRDDALLVGGPAFQVVTADADVLPTMLDAFRKALAEIHVRRRGATVDIAARDVVAPADLPPLMDIDHEEGRCIYLGLAVRPVYRDPQSGNLYPIVLQRLREQLAPAFRKLFAALAGTGRDDALPHYQSFGPTSLVRAVQTVDQQLCDVADAFDFVYQATPINAEPAWRRFAEKDFDEPPTFWYRPLPYDPNLLKRRLFEVPIERIEDTTMAHLFAEKQVELDRQLSALRDMETSNFLYSSIQLYGRPDEELQSLAQCLLHEYPEPDYGPGEETPSGGVAGASEVASVAREEIAYYRRAFEGFEATVEICNDIAAGLMVIGERLLVSESVQIPRRRLAALMHHEVGTHLLTHCNGRAQPFRQLHAGLAGYESLQEGLAVLTEFLAGGLTPSRLRQLAGRVVAVHAVCDGATFIETFRRLRRDCGFTSRAAFRMTLRAHRGGGLTKDLVYLQGVRDLLHYLQQDHDLEPLFVGKIALEHVPFVRELRRRDIIRPPAILPRLLETDEARRRLEQIRGAAVIDLCGVLA